VGWGQRPEHLRTLQPLLHHAHTGNTFQHVLNTLIIQDNDEYRQPSYHLFNVLNTLEHSARLTTTITQRATNPTSWTPLNILNTYWTRI